MSNELTITSLEAIKKYSEGQIVEFPPFAEGQPFVARVCRPSLLALAEAGKIPNSLLETANGLFAGKGVDVKNKTAMKDIFEVFHIICEECLMEPTYKEVKEAGMKLTDEQMTFIFNYTQQGIKVLEPFHQQSKNTKRSLRK